MILIVDFGGQTCHLISRRLKDLGIETLIIDPENILNEVTKYNPKGLIFSGGPASVFEKNAPTITKKVFDLKIPILGICYGWQLTSYLLGGDVKPGKKEYGPAKLTITDFSNLFFGLPQNQTVWESHGTTVIKLPKNYHVIGTTQSVEYAAVRDAKKLIFGVQFHPEMFHTENGTKILENFANRICQIASKPKQIDILSMINEIKKKVGNKKVIGAFSGGTDSAIAGTLVAKAIGKQFTPIYVDSGLMREETLERIKTLFPKVLGLDVEVIKAKKIFLKKLKGVTDPEEKRKTIGKLYIDLFEQYVKRRKHIKFLMQGTTYADFIHSKGTKKSAHIKSHHNVGGLPKKMKLELLEPLKYFYTDQVREIGLQLNLPHEIVFQQPFPGPGHAVRILGEVTEKKLQKQKLADSILIDEMKKSGWYEKVFQCWTVLTNAQSTAVKGDERFFGDVIALRILNSKDRMTADWVRLPYDLLARISARIVNEVPEVSRVVYDITTKPPATMEWE